MRVGLLILCGSLVVASLALLAACGSDEPSSSPEPVSDVTSASDATPSDASPTACPSGHIVGPDGACMAVGIQGCDGMFIDPETGLCDPSLVDCPLGSIPIFGGEDQGCRPVGIQGCDDMFIDPETGMCDPAYLECPPGQIPIFGGEDQGCRAVGIVDCHPDFFDAETGRCDPQEDSCPEGSMAIPTAGCVSLDPPGGCGDGTWGNIEELPGDVHLDVNYAGDDSDGSREKPWTLYGYALGQVQAGGRIVLAAGDYDQGLLVSKSISLVGRCSSMVTISGMREGAAGPTVVEVKGDVEVEISDLTISGPGYGLVAHSGAEISLSRASLKNNHGSGLVASGPGTSLTASEVWVSGTQLDGEGLSGYGVVAQSGVIVILSRSRVSDNHSAGLMADGSGTTLTASEVWVSGTQLTSAGLRGYGVDAAMGAIVSVTRSRVSDNHSAGLMADGSGTTLTASEVWVSGTQLSGAGLRGYGVLAQSGASVNVTRSRVSDNHNAGLLADGSGANLTASEVWVSGTQLDGEGLYGYGGLAYLGASLSMSRSHVSDNFQAAVGFYAGGGSVTESLLEGTKFGGSLLGDGLMATGSVVTVDRVIARDNARVGVLFDKSEGELSKSLITQNAVGLANQGLPGAAISDDNVIEGNDQDRLDDGDLEVPDEAMSLPDLPAFD